MSVKPNQKSIKIINKLYKNNYIIIFTSRYMGRNNDNVRRQNQDIKNIQSIKKWKLNFHELRFGKPSYDFFLDDKNIFFKNGMIILKKYL